MEYELFYYSSYPKSNLAKGEGFEPIVGLLPTSLAGKRDKPDSANLSVKL